MGDAGGASSGERCRKLEACDYNTHDEVGLFSYWQNQVVCCIFHLESRVLILNICFPLFKNGFQMQKNRNAEVSDIDQRKCSLPSQTDFAPGCLQTYFRNFTHAETGSFTQRSILAVTGKIHNLALYKPWSGFTVYTLASPKRARRNDSLSLY